MGRKAIIIGAGPAGLTAAYELLQRTGIQPVILEKSGDIGGISKTVNYKGNRIDIGGHRFFSKSDRVMNWWLEMMPVEEAAEKYLTITYQKKKKTIVREESAGTGQPGTPEKVMLVRKRLSRIYFLRKFFTYPIQLSVDTLQKLGLTTTMGIIFSYLKAQIFPRKPEKSLEDFLINRFGVKLYLLFFKDYTEKVWGVPCGQISAEWGAQRIKGVSISKAVRHAITTALKSSKKGADLSQKDTETSLIEQFLYPKLGPGQLWEEVARQVEALGGVIHHHQQVTAINTDDSRVTSVETRNTITGEKTILEGDYFFSTMPVQELIAGMKSVVPPNVQEVAAGLQYRDFITVGVLLSKLTPPKDKVAGKDEHTLPDTWIYIQERDVKVGRLQIFNNWSPSMVKDPANTWIGMEYFCNEGDDFWSLDDEAIKALAIAELEKMELAIVEDVLDSTVLRTEKTYPAYFGTYNRFDEIKTFTDSFANLFLVGRNGMHKYNNSDHSMLTAMVAVDNIAAGVLTKENIWSINTEQEYHEEKAGAEAAPTAEKEKVATLKELPRASVSPEATVSFKNFLFNNQENLRMLKIAGIVLVLLLVIFKWLYPFASFINGDSYTYMDAADKNLSINTYPIGYSRFLRLFTALCNSDTLLVAFQYLALQASLLGFVFTLFYFYQPARWAKISLLAFFTVNPVFLYLANYVSSDCVFLTVSITWFTMLLWLIYRPTWRLIIWHAILIGIAFTIRYNALFYPLIAAVAFLFSKQRFTQKLAGIGMSIAFIGLFMFYTSNHYYRLTGTRQFSPFTGWQLANNAMYGYRFIDSSARRPAPLALRGLDNEVRTYFDSTRDLRRFSQDVLVASTVYMWDPHSPMQVYMQKQFEKQPGTPKLKKWASMSPLYNDYGRFLIKQYPANFWRFYLWPNMLKYYAPPVEFLQTYNMGRDTVNKTAMAWFGYTTNKVTSRFKDKSVSVLNFMPVLSGTMNILFLCTFIGLFYLGVGKKNRMLATGIKLAACFWLVNCGFSVFASPIALRFQLFPIILSTVFGTICLDYIIRQAKVPEIDYAKTREMKMNLQ